MEKYHGREIGEQHRRIDDPGAEGLCPLWTLSPGVSDIFRQRQGGRISPGQDRCTARSGRESVQHQRRHPRWDGKLSRLPCM
jgi:hypothetical protein